MNHTRTIRTKSAGLCCAGDWSSASVLIDTCWKKETVSSSRAAYHIGTGTQDQNGPRCCGLTRPPRIEKHSDRHFDFETKGRLKDESSDPWRLWRDGVRNDARPGDHERF